MIVLKYSISFKLYIVFEEKKLSKIICCFTIPIKHGLIKFLIPINIHNFVFSPYKIKSQFLVPVTFSLSILGTKNVDEIF